ncbi:ComN-like post-transcriptional regulator [Psychrobacillus insolitus]|uniref:ComN-like post-transcriptional regulator n=1 Tax=Psychrobacillus insolitus TaxID=1461 RepID=A0A2W7MTH0_9BACI|nr:post-transcriptional regulator [Psychrobacillus insolitus]PZX07111.1 ComN-like post-transcriptional regulator [Psychrobacillus insolitus]
MEIRYKEMYTHVLPAIESKKSEFEVYNYQTVTEEDIWNYCVTKKWRKEDIAMLPLHKVINDVLSISSAEFMTFEQIEKYKSSNWFKDINKEELQLLLNPKNTPE